MHRFMLLLALAIASPPGYGGEPRDRFGGWTEVRGKATGFFHAEPIGDIWWLITPDGNAFFSKGANHISFAGDRSPALGYSPYGKAAAARYGTADQWASATAERLRGWGFNTVGAWSSREMFAQRMPYTVNLDLAASAGANWLKGEVADVFANGFREALQVSALKRCNGRADDPFLLGYFTDNELRWGADWRSKKSLFEEFLGRPGDSAGKQAVVRLLRARYSTVESFNQAWGTELKDLEEIAQLTSLPTTSEAAKKAQQEFLGEYARGYFRACRDAIRAADPNHLILGCRFAGNAPAVVLEGMREFVDVVSFNNYSYEAPVETLRNLHQATGRPIILTEFSFKAKDSGLPNTRGAGKAVPTQQDRARLFETYVTGLGKTSFMVGYHWFEYADEPAEGRFDGENSNYGLVNIKDEPWTVLVKRMQQVNAGIEALHRGAAVR